MKGSKLSFKKTILKILKTIGIAFGGLVYLTIIIGMLFFIGLFIIFRSIDCDTTEVFNVTGNYRLSYYCEKESMTLYYNNKKEYGGSRIIDETVFQVDWNDNWIIVKQYPNLEKPIEERLFNYSKETGHYELTNPNDTIYLSKDDRYYEKEGKWYHISNGWTPPDTLYPYRKKINYFVIDAKADNQIIFNADSEERLIELRDSLGIPKKLKSQKIFEELK